MDKSDFDECMPTIPRDDDTATDRVISPSAPPVATDVSTIAGAQLLANIALLLHGIEPKDREMVMSRILDLRAGFDTIDPLRNRGLVVSIASDMRLVCEFTAMPEMPTLLLTLSTGEAELVDVPQGRPN